MKQTDEELRLPVSSRQKRQKVKKLAGTSKWIRAMWIQTTMVTFSRRKKLRLSCQNLHETKVTTPVRNQIGGDEGSAGSSVAPVANTQDKDDDDEDDETSINKSAKDKKYRYSYDYFKEWDKFDVEGELSKLDEADKEKERKIKQLERKNKEKEKLRFERMERDLKALGLKSDMLVE